MKGSTPSVGLDWWNFWFQEESFPTQLGWVPAHTSVFDINFITSVSKAVLGAKITSTPKSLPADATKTSQSPAGNLPEADPSPTFPLFQSAPYAAVTKPAAITPAAKKREAAPALSVTDLIPTSILSAVASDISSAPDLVVSALSIVGPAPKKFNFYAQTLDTSSVKAQIAEAQSFEEAVLAAVTSLASP